MTDQTTDRVADAPIDIWVYRLLPKYTWPYAQLARWDRPIGWWLLLWPCWWSLALATGLETELGRFVGDPAANLSRFIFYTIPQLFWFWLGAVAMRGAGCTYNDIVDLKIDARVERTASRPIPSGRVSRLQATLFTVAQALVGLLSLYLICSVGQLSFNSEVFMLAFASLLIVACYPFAKRITNWPQLVLGLAFSCGALLGWLAVINKSDEHPSQLFDVAVRDSMLAPILLYVGCILWTIGYDTIYAHQDKEDDALIGVRSTARLFGEKTKLALILLYFCTLVLFAAAFFVANANWPSYFGLAVGCGHMIWQIRTLDIDNADNCLALFKSNKTFGWIIFAGLLADIWI